MKTFGRLVLAARRKERLEESVERLAEMGIETSYQECDVAVLSDVEALADFAWDQYGHVDGRHQRRDPACCRRCHQYQGRPR